MIKKLKEVIELFRPNQWYKNLVIFLPIIFSKNLFNFNLFLITLYGFFILIMISSANYILNDLIDIKRDRFYLEKKNAPIVSGKISKSFAIVVFAVMVVLSFVLSYLLNIYFFYCVLLIFLVSFLYSIYLKNIPLVDLLLISINFVLRSVSGAFVIGVFISFWLILGVFLSAFYLILCKRYGEIKLLGKEATKYRPVLKYYNQMVLHFVLWIFLVLLILSYFLFWRFSNHIHILYAFPFFTFIILHYNFLVTSQNKIITPNKILKNPYVFIEFLIFLILVILLIYI